MLLDECGTADPVAGTEPRTVISRRRSKSAIETDIPPTGHRSSPWHGFAALDPFRRRLAQRSDDGAAQADNLGRLLRRRRAVTQRVHGVERALDRPPFPFF